MDNNNVFSNQTIETIETMDIEWSKIRTDEKQDMKQIPSTRGYHTASLVDDTLYVFGGNGNECCLDDLYACRLSQKTVTIPKSRSQKRDTTANVSRCTWTRVKTTGTPPVARRSHNTVVVDRKLVVFGGFNNEWQVLPLDLNVLDLDTMHWTTYKTSPAAPKGRAGASADVVNGVIYMIGGNTGENRTNQILALPVHSLHAPIWTVLHPDGTLPQSRSAHTTAVVGNRILVFGGWNGTEDYNDLHVFDTETVSWNTMKNTVGSVPRPCSGQWAVPLLDKIVLFGGQIDTGDTFIDDMYMFHPNSDRFRKVRPFNVDQLPIRSGHSVTRIDSQRALIFGGWDGEDFTNDVFIIKLGSIRSDLFSLCNL